MSGYSKDYHDYVIRDGKLIGEFEAMYRHSEGVPWRQDEQQKWVDVRLTAEMLRDLAPFEEIHDLGCGLGYYLALLRNSLGDTQTRAFGYDVSPTACAKAAGLFPQFSFTTLDLTADSTGVTAPDLPARRLFVIRGTLWYVFPKLANVVDLIRAMMGAGDRLLVVQNFPPLERPFVGKDVLPDHHALIGHFARRFTPVRHLWYQDSVKTANDNWFIGLFSTGQR